MTAVKLLEALGFIDEDLLIAAETEFNNETQKINLI